jgi:DNA repair protein RadA/Sms
MKVKTTFRCQECGYASARWLGKCPECEHWNSLVEEREQPEPSAAAARRRPLTEFSSEVTALEDIESMPLDRAATGLTEFDRVMGGGVVTGSMILLGGAPGIGKSTLMLQICEGLCRAKGKGLYISGEESLQQVRDRAQRLNIRAPNLSLLSETELSKMTEAIEKVKPAFVVIDSIQTTYRQDLASSPGSVGQVRECAAEFLRIAKSRGITLFMLGHVTKEGDLAGPRVLEHIVDTVLYFESEREQLFRLLRSHKNRFGPTHEVGVFRMTPKGLAGVASPSEVFLSQRTQAPGSAVVGSLEGTRPLMLEVQALVARTHFGFPKRMVTGLDYNRTLLLIAVLEKRLGLHLENEDVYVNVVGGLRVKEPAVDLGVAMAILSAHRNQSLDPNTLWIGEVGLGGEVRAVGAIPLRLMEATQLGFKRAVVPQQSLREIRQELQAMKLEIHGISTLSEALEELPASERSLS